MSAPASAFNYEESIKRFTYFGISKLLKESEYSNNYDSNRSQDSIPNNLLNKYLELIGREIMRDEAPSLDDIETKTTGYKGANGIFRQWWNKCKRKVQ